MEKMTLVQFGTDTYGAQLSLACDLAKKTIYFRLLSLFNGKKNVEDFTDFATSVDAYNAFVAGTRLTEYGEKVRDDFFAKCKEYAEANPEKFPNLDTTKRFPICGFNEIVKDAKDVAGAYLNDMAITAVLPEAIFNYLWKDKSETDAVIFGWSDGTQITYKEVTAELERCLIQEVVTNE